MEAEKCQNCAVGGKSHHPICARQYASSELKLRFCTIFRLCTYFLLTGNLAERLFHRARGWRHHHSDWVGETNDLTIIGSIIILKECCLRSLNTRPSAVESPFLKDATRKVFVLLNYSGLVLSSNTKVFQQFIQSTLDLVSTTLVRDLD